MKLVTYYDPATGLFRPGHLTTSDDAAVALNARGFVAMEGHYDPLCQRVDLATKQVVDYQPPQPDADHEWNASSKRWVLNAAAQATQHATRAAQARLAELTGQQHALVRRLVLDPSDAAAREALTALDKEASSLGG